MPAPNMPMGGPPNQGPSFNGQMMHQQAWGNAGPPNAPPNMPGGGGGPPQGNWGNQQAPPQQNYYNQNPGIQQPKQGYNPGPLAAPGRPQAGNWNPSQQNQQAHNKNWSSNPNQQKFNQNNNNSFQKAHPQNPFAWINSLPVESYTKQLNELNR